MALTKSQTRHLLSVLLVVWTIAVFWPVRQNGFINYDDPKYITQNAIVQAGLTWRGVVWALSTGHTGNWHPLTWLSHMVDCQLYGPNPAGHHLTSVVIHCCAAAMLLQALYRMTGALWASALVAALFAVHPLRVESVAWASERKDVLCAFFWMASLWAYVRYVERPRTASYLILLGVYAVGLLTKSMLVTLPFLLLVLDYWPLRRMRQMAGDGRDGPEDSVGRPVRSRTLRELATEKAPLIVLSFLMSIVTYLAQSRGGSVGTVENYPLLSRLGNVLISYAAYVRLTLWPAGLAVFYPHRTDAMDLLETLGPALLLICVSFWAWRWRHQSPFLLTGWLWYLGTLVPVVGIVHIGLHEYADRYSYIPQVGLLIMAVWGVRELLKGWRHRRTALVAASLASILVLSLLTRRQVERWRDSLTLFQHVIKVTQDNPLAYNNFAIALIAQGRYEEAETCLTAALAIQPDYTYAHNNLGLACLRQDKLDRAEEHFSISLTHDASDAKVHLRLGEVFEKQERWQEAAKRYREVLRLAPGHAEGRAGLARAKAGAAGT